MTEQEAEALAARLTRIWESEARHDTPLWRNKPDHFYFFCYLPGEVYLKFFIDGGRTSVELDSIGEYCELRYREGIIDSVHTNPSDDHELDDLEQFSIGWMLLFRRNCWLSGVPIEATAHEKAEWMQEFSHEELEAWNLKM